AGADQAAVPGRGADLAGIDATLPGRRADEALRRARGDRRACAVHVLGRMRLHDRRHGLCERRRRMAVSLSCATPTPATRMRSLVDRTAIDCRSRSKRSIELAATSKYPMWH